MTWQNERIAKLERTLEYMLVEYEALKRDYARARKAWGSWDTQLYVEADQLTNAEVKARRALGYET